MAVNEPIDPRVRLAISQWPKDAPRGSVSTFCVEHNISRKSFDELRKRALVDGPAAVLEPRSRRAGSSPSKLTEEVKAQAQQVRAAMEASGLDHGPVSVGSFMLAGVHYMVSGSRGFQQVIVIVECDNITIADLDGEILIEHTRPAPGVTYVGNGRPRGPRPKTTETSPKS